MKKYAITKNNEIVFGPAEWVPVDFQSCLYDNGLSVSLPLIVSTMPIIINDFVISEVVEIIPDYDSSIYQLCKNPIVTCNDNTVTSTYSTELIPVTPYIDPQTLKPLDLKKAENNYCIYMNTMAQTYGLTLTPDMTRQQLLAAASTAGLSGMPLIEARQTIMELLNDVNVNGGRYGDIAFHQEILG